MRATVGLVECVASPARLVPKDRACRPGRRATGRARDMLGYLRPDRRVQTVRVPLNPFRPGHKPSKRFMQFANRGLLLAGPPH